MMQPASGTSPAAALELGLEERPTSWLRPGVAFPDWSVVTSASAGAALIAMLEAAWDRRAWQHYTPAEDAVRQSILELYRDLGRAPSLEKIARRSGIAPERVRTLLERLAARDLIVLEGCRITGAYPLTDRPSEHRVLISDRALHAMCAIDALGVGAMYRTDTAIASRCRSCGVPIEISTHAQGATLDLVAPAQTVVFAAVGYRGGCAATSLCTTIAFFCSNGHLAAWRADQPLDAPGFRLSIEEAFEIGRAIFGPVLMPRPPAL